MPIRLSSAITSVCATPVTAPAVQPLAVELRREAKAALGAAVARVPHAIPVTTILSQKPILYVVNVSESSELGTDLAAAVARYDLAEIASQPNAGATAICGKVEAELAEMSDDEAAEFLGSYGLAESGLTRLIRKTYELLGLISFFTVGEDECRAWTVPRGVRAPEAAGVIHSDLEKHFIRAETIRWDQLLEAGSEAAARAKGTLRLEGKDYIVQDGDVMNIRHSA